jgi:hypothetical protein
MCVSYSAFFHLPSHLHLHLKSAVLDLNTSSASPHQLLYPTSLPLLTCHHPRSEARFQDSWCSASCPVGTVLEVRSGPRNWLYHRWAGGLQARRLTSIPSSVLCPRSWEVTGHITEEHAEWDIVPLSSLGKCSSTACYIMCFPNGFTLLCILIA